MIQKGSWVRIHGIALKPEERATNLPEETKKVPLEFWTKGRLQQDAEIGDTVTVITAVGRKQEGTLVEVNPIYELNYGKLVPELIAIDEQLRSLLEEIND
ncbi:2-amino-4-oxopentanoate thiolase subunit OrtA [Guggenheimella bovis]